MSILLGIFIVLQISHASSMITSVTVINTAINAVIGLLMAILVVP